MDIDGGAAELSWSLRTFAGNSISCRQAKIDKIRLCWTPASDDRQCPGESRSFDCDDETGVTTFQIEPGDTKLFIEPLCADGLPPSPGTFQTPSPIVREVKEGEVVTLDSFLIIVTEPCSGTGCTCFRSSADKISVSL